MEKWTVAQLKEELKFYGLSVKGKKGQLINRMREFFRSQASNFKPPKSKGTVQDRHDTVVADDDAASVRSKGSSKASKGSKASKASKSMSLVSSVSSARLKEATRIAELQAEAATLGKKQLLDQKRFELTQEEARINLETEIAKAKAKDRVLADMESKRSVDDGTNGMPSLKLPSFFEKCDDWLRAKDNFRETKIKTKAQTGEDEFKPLPRDRSSPKNNSGEIVRDFIDLQMQQNEMMKLIHVQQQRSTLPNLQVPVFHGDPLEYQTFIHAFESLVEAKTTNGTEKLHYLEQYTSGEVRELVCSCHFLAPNTGFVQAKRLLQKRYGDQYRIASAYVEKALNWPEIKHNDAAALHRYSIFLNSCVNAMLGNKYLDKFEHPDNIKRLVLKLPYNLRDRWRRRADDIMEVLQAPVTFEDLVDYVNKEARIASNPIFGKNAMPDTSRDKFRGTSTVKPSIRPNLLTAKMSSLAVQAKVNSTQKIQKDSHDADQSQNCCLFCTASNHVLENCNALRRKPYKERIEFLMKKRLCFGCLADDHTVKECTQKKVCKFPDCTKSHPAVLHTNSTSNSSNSDNPNKNEQSVNNEVQDTNKNSPKSPMVNSTSVKNTCIKISENTCSTGAGQPSTGMAVLPVKVRPEGTSGFIVTYALLDSGSTSTFCTESLMNKLNVTGIKTKISLTTLGKKGDLTETFLIRGLEIADLDENHLIKLPCLFTQQEIPVEKSDIATQEDVDRWPYLSSCVQITTPDSSIDIGLLLANDVPEALDPQEVIHSQHGGPYATRTKLGWTINGPLKRNHESSHVSNFRVKADIQLDQIMTNFFNQEFNDSISSHKTEMSQMERRFLSSVESSAILKNGHYYIDLPLKNPELHLPNNKPQAISRARWLKKRFIKDPKLHQDYKNFMSDLLSKDFAQKIPLQAMNQSPERIWYLPHHGVYHPYKPEKVRVVFNCSAKYQDVSLNDHLMKGPDLTNTLLGVLFRFRQEHVALMADVEAMYHQVRVPEQDRNLLRFLWWPQGNIDRELEEYHMNVHLFGAVSSPSVANFALRKTALDNKQDHSPSVVSTVLNNFYVDDCLKSLPTVQDAITHSKELSELLLKGGFRLTKWVSNSRKVISAIPESERNKCIKELNLTKDELPVERALGVNWNIEQDEFGIKISLKERVLSRRGILSLVSSAYDPLGFVSPFMLQAKSILQDLCRRKLDWDEEIPAECHQQWKRWLSDLPKLAHFTVQRCYKPTNFGPVIATQLHHFSDASQVGYGSVSYLRVINDRGEIHCSFVMAKSRVVPLKQITIPRLELTAATVSVRLDKIIKDELELIIDKSTFWTDSTSVIRYVGNETARFHTFVANRVAQIRDGSDPSQWRYINTASNPADYASRGLSADELLNKKQWIKGPNFLWEDDSVWPQATKSETCSSQNDPEVKREVKACMTSTCSNAANEIFEKFSSWYHLKKIIAWILRYFKNLKKALQQHKETARTRRIAVKSILPISLKEMQDAEKEILHQVQQQAFHQEMRVLKENNDQRRKSVIRKSSPMFKLDPVLKNELICVGGRLRNAPISDRAKHPIILPKNHHVTSLIIKDYHHMSGHSGKQHVLAQLRQRYWIMNANTVVKKALEKYFDCRRRQSRPLQQKMGDLPDARLTPDKPPFTAVGADYFGPFFVHRGRSLVKRYGVIFTCMTTRAVHLEVASSLDTNSFLLALRRFIARRGQVEEIFSDNGTNFTSGDKELRECLKQWNREQINESLLQKNVQWHYSPPFGSHHGGVWERHIRTIRKILSALLKEQTLDDENLLTLMCEVEAIINSRPLTTVSDDKNDLEPLTPNHLILLKSKSLLPPGLFSKEDSYTRRRWKQVQYLSDVFWRRWTREYLPTLQIRHKWCKTSRNLKMNDVVLILDENVPRNKWILGRVIQIFEDAKGFVRRAKLKTKSTILERPITKLCLLVGADD